MRLFFTEVSSRQISFPFAAQLSQFQRAGRRAWIAGREVKRMTYLNGYFARLLAAGRREEGQTMAEYGVILAVITVAIIAVLVLLSDGIRNNLQAVVDVLS
jgi:Flp pilus assembly pilin Flp